MQVNCVIYTDAYISPIATVAYHGSQFISHLLCLLSVLILHHHHLTPVSAAAPRFPYKEQILRVSVDEAVPLGTTVARVTADEVSQHVNYSMQAWRATIQERENQLFEMDSRSGQVKTRALIDLENPAIKKQYKYKVEASNAQGETSFCWLIIDVNDINDNPPIFSSQTYKFKGKLLCDIKPVN